MKALLIGKGRMGTLIAQTLTQQGHQVVLALDDHTVGGLAQMGRVADVVLDFSAPSALEKLAPYIARTGTPLVSGVTGYTPQQMVQLEALGRTAAVLWSANYSLGVAVLTRALAQITPILKDSFDIEVTETHHNQKVDAPSGTANLLLSALDPKGEMARVYGRSGITGQRPGREIGVHSLRGGTQAGTHSVHFFGEEEELTLTHRATNRQIFVNGALHMAKRLPGHPVGFYDIQTILFEE